MSVCSHFSFPFFQPVLPANAACAVCHEGEKPDAGEDEGELLECGICWHIHHAACFHSRYGLAKDQGVINEDLPSSWECPTCVQEGKQGTSQVHTGC
jgi:rubredoxin